MIISGYALGSKIFFYLNFLFLVVFSILFFRECGAQIGKGVLLGSELIGKDNELQQTLYEENVSE